MAWDSLLFTPDPEMSEDEFNKLMLDCYNAQQQLDAFCREEITESDLEDALEFFGVDPVELSETFNHNLDVFGW